MNGRVPVIVDSGFRRGTDMFKALALGATAVGVGRPYIWGLGAFGQAGVERVLDILARELRDRDEADGHDEPRQDLPQLAAALTTRRLDRIAPSADRDARRRGQRLALHRDEHAPPMPAQAVLPEIDALPRAEREPTVADRDREIGLREHAAHVRRHVVRAFGRVHEARIAVGREVAP